MKAAVIVGPVVRNGPDELTFSFELQTSRIDPLPVSGHSLGACP
jgi:hypothetical protein